MTLERQKEKISFNIYRKPTYTDNTIPSDSQHPWIQKLSTFQSMVHRAFSLPLSQIDLSIELETIKSIAKNNGYKTEIINKLINKKQSMVALSEIYPNIRENPEKYISLTYYGKVSDYIGKLVSNSDIKVAFKPQSKISNILFNAKDQKSKFDQSGVYKLICSECDAFYIGQTGRSFAARYKEHLRSYTNKKMDSTFAAHCTNEKHQFPYMSDMKILHVCQKSSKLNYLESLEIHKAKSGSKSKELLNQQTDIPSCSSSLFKIFGTPPRW